MQAYDHSFGVIFFGDQPQAKLDYISRFSGDAAVKNHKDPILIIDHKTRDIEVQGERVKMHCWWGNERAHFANVSWKTKASAYVVVVDLTDNESIKRLQEWHQEIESFAPRGSTIPILWVGVNSAKATLEQKANFVANLEHFVGHDSKSWLGIDLDAALAADREATSSLQEGIPLTMFTPKGICPPNQSKVKLEERAILDDGSVEQAESVCFTLVSQLTSIANQKNQRLFPSRNYA